MGQSVCQHDSAIDHVDSLETGKLRTRIVPTLSSLPDDCLQRVTADGGPFAVMQWYRMLEQVDLSAITGGAIELNFAVTSVAETPVAICPILRARGGSLYAPYSFRRFYFESWIEHLRRRDPEWAVQNESSFALVDAYRRLLEGLKCSLDDFLIVLSPLTLRLQLPVAALSSGRGNEVTQHLIDRLKGHAEDVGRPLWFLGTPESLSQTLGDAGFECAFFSHDNHIDVSRFDCFEDYLQSFSSKNRYGMLREMRRNASAGVRFRWVDDFAPHAEAFARLYHNTYTKNQTSILQFTPDVWQSLNEGLQGRTQTLLAERDGRLIGFHLCLTSDTCGDMYGYRIGRSYESELQRLPVYFELCIYEPVRRAIEQGCHTYGAGVGASDAKTRRGSQPRPLYHCFWFPRLRDRWLLRPYLQKFGETALRRGA